MVVRKPPSLRNLVVLAGSRLLLGVVAGVGLLAGAAVLGLSVRIFMTLAGF